MKTVPWGKVHRLIGGRLLSLKLQPKSQNNIQDYPEHTALWELWFPLRQALWDCIELNPIILRKIRLICCII